MTSESGRIYYLGTSSNWSFTRRLLSVTYEHVHKRPIPPTALLFDGETYDLGWQSDRAATSAAALPTIDYATHLVNTVRFHCGQVFHLFDEDVFMGHLRDHYADSMQRCPARDLWLVHFQLILAFGKAFATKPRHGSRPPGVGFFVNALHSLPNMTVLWRDPVQAIEILCCVGLYLHCIDYRSSAYNYIGQAVRMAMSQGLHTDVPIEQLGEAIVQRYRKVWWTVYVLDREMTSLMGLPQSVRDEDVHTQLPTFQGDPFRTVAFIMRTKLSHFIASIDRAVYRPDGRLDNNFLMRTKDALAGLAGLTDELHERFPLLLDNDESGISRLSAHLHLLYNQCIVLATRPLLFCFFQIRLESLGSCLDLLNTSSTVRSVLQMCLDSSQHVVSILECLQHQGLLETFLSFDLEALFISTTNILVAPTLYPDSAASWAQWRHKAHMVYDELSRSGNLIAQAEQSELERLGGMLDSIDSSPARNVSNPPPNHAEPSSIAHSEAAPGELHPPLTMPPTPFPGGSLFDENYFGTELSAAQIMDMVNSIDSGHTQWVSQAMVEHGI
ncbi:hypothetical protein JDV02_004119 [Purpureocillium takamizusanense]|uniref:Xylanolytic transcriptional activator regulatory domain-containing protein n=1 Tax=Purpureocillium takamizusanense TaxID=2060973 RepID=A0A9Q8QDS3_9HYPO|nr:uncharacterized protein JDV02_004119 [Purpureocillium takamizusanense]UNI17800.1 hypothetical protein JDV02_004119 [Purpureocillium takamizusanense]